MYLVYLDRGPFSHEDQLMKHDRVLLAYSVSPSPRVTRYTQEEDGLQEEAEEEDGDRTPDGVIQSPLQEAV